MPHPRPLPEMLAGRPFTVAHALTLGVGRDRLERSDLVAPFSGVRAPTGAADDAFARAGLALMACGDRAFLSGVSAARVIGIPLPNRHLRSGQIEVAVAAPGRAMRRRGIDGRVRAVAPADVIVWRGLRTTSPCRTWCDLADALTVPELVAAGDWMLRRGFATARFLEHAAVARADRRGIGRIRIALPMIDPRAESPKESEVRALIVLAGLPPATPNVEIFAPDGRFVARVDLLFAGYREVVEYQGDHHRTDRAQWRRDRTREAELESLGYHVTEVTDDDLAVPAAMLTRLGRNLRRRGWSG